MICVTAPAYFFALFSCSLLFLIMMKPGNACDTMLNMPSAPEGVYIWNPLLLFPQLFSSYGSQLHVILLCIYSSFSSVDIWI